MWNMSIYLAIDWDFLGSISYWIYQKVQLTFPEVQTEWRHWGHIKVKVCSNDPRACKDIRSKRWTLSWLWMCSCGDFEWFLSLSTGSNYRFRSTWGQNQIISIYLRLWPWRQSIEDLKLTRFTTTQSVLGSHKSNKSQKESMVIISF